MSCLPNPHYGTAPRPTGGDVCEGEIEKYKKVTRENLFAFRIRCPTQISTQKAGRAVFNYTLAFSPVLFQSLHSGPERTFLFHLLGTVLMSYSSFFRDMKLTFMGWSVFLIIVLAVWLFVSLYHEKFRI